MNDRLPLRVLVVTGPTASGKTELAAALARAVGAEIVGADSRQVYRYMDVGTAKPTAALRREVRHYCIDVVDPDRPYDVAAWRADALEALAEVRARGKRAIVCGGTGLYLRSLERGLFAGPVADEALRERLRADEAARPGALHERLATVDPETALRVHRNDVVRQIRALEVLELTGRTLSAWHHEHALGEHPFETVTLELRVDRAELVRCIDERSRAIVAAGIVDELRALYERGYAADSKAFDAIGYREAARAIRGELRIDELAGEIAKATRAYAKRQLVWLRGQHDTVAVAAGDHERAVELAAAFFDRVANSQGIG